MTVLYCGLRYDYGKRDQGDSYEHWNIEAGLRKFCLDNGHPFFKFYPDKSTGNDWIRFDRMIAYKEIDVIFHVAFNDELDLPRSTALAALEAGIPVIQWDCDSSWRFNNWILPRKDRVSHFITTHSATIPWYERHGMNVIKSQWAGSPRYIREESKERDYDITFVGQKHGQMPNGKFFRQEVVEFLISRGLNVRVFGNYWDGCSYWGGYLNSFEDMIDVFNRSKICLNISNPWHHGTMPQIKGRHFEIPQCGGLQISTPADNLESYFEFGKEIEVMNNLEELADRCKYFLENEGAASRIREAGYQRMKKDHQWRHRFEEIFQSL